MDYSQHSTQILPGFRYTAKNIKFEVLSKFIIIAKGTVNGMEETKVYFNNSSYDVVTQIPIPLSLSPIVTVLNTSENYR